MSELRNLVIKTGIDNTGLTSGLGDSSQIVDKWCQDFGAALSNLDVRQAVTKVQDVTSAMANIKPPTLSLPAPTGGASTGEAANPVADLAATIEPLFSKIESGLTGALRPLTSYAARFSAQFDQVGGAVLALSQRIDEHMKFPKFQERIGQVRSLIQKTFLDAEKDVQPPIRQIQARVVQVAETWTTAVAEIEHSKPDLSGFVHEVERAQTAVNNLHPPDDGKGYDLDKGARSNAAKASAAKRRRGADGKFAPKDAFVPPIVTEDQLPARAIPAPISGDWSVVPYTKQLDLAHSKLAEVGRVASTTSKAIDLFGRVAGTSLSGVGLVAKGSLGIVSTGVKGVAIAADAGLAAWLRWEQLKGFWRNLGSVAEKSFAIMAKVKVPTISMADVSAGKQIEAVGKAASVAIGPVKGLGREIAMALGFVGLVYKGTQAFADFIVAGVKGASDLNETLGMTRNVLGDAAPGVEKFADTMSAKFGIVKKDTLEVAAALGGLGKGLGDLKGKQLEDFTKKFTMMAADLSSSKNISFADAGKALQIALSGEQSDTLKQLGVITTETTIKNIAYKNSIAKVGDELNAQQKLQAVGIALTEKLAFADGDLQETIGGAANAFRRFSGTITNLGNDIGTLLLPVLVKGLGIFNEFASGGLLAGFEKLKPSITSFANGVGAALGKVADQVKALVPVVVDFLAPYIAAGLDKAGEAFAAIGGVIDDLKPTFTSLITEVGAAFTAVGGAVGSALPTVDEFRATVQATFNNVVAAVTTMLSTLVAIPTMLNDTFGANATKDLLLFAAAVGAITLAIGAAGSVLGTVASVAAGIAGVFTSIPILIGAAVAGVLYLSGVFTSWSDVIDTVAFAWRNLGDIFGIVYARIKGYVLTIVDWIRNLAVAMAKFAANPLAGFTMAPMTDHLAQAEKDIAKRYDSIAKREADLRKKISAPIKAAELIGPPRPEVSVPAPVKKPTIDPGTKELSDFAEKISEKVKTPVEKFKAELAKLDLAKSKGLIDDETYQRGKSQAIKDSGFGDVAKASEPIERFKAEMQRLNDGLKAGAIDQGAFDTLRDKAAKDAFGSVIKHGDDPAAKYNEVMAQAREAFKAGAIDEKELLHIQRDATKEYKQGSKKEGDGEQKFAKAQELGSADFYESVVKAVGGKGQQSSLERLNQSQLSTQERIAKGIDKVGDRLGRRPEQVGIN